MNRSFYLYNKYDEKLKTIKFNNIIFNLNDKNWNIWLKYIESIININNNSNSLLFDKIIKSKRSVLI